MLFFAAAALVSLVEFAWGRRVPDASVRLAWTDSDPTVTGYYVYYGTYSGGYTQAIDVGDTTNALISGLWFGTNYFFAVTAYNSNGVQSAYSPEVSYMPFGAPFTNCITFSAGPAFSMTFENPPNTLFAVVRSNGEVQLSIDLTNWEPIYNIGEWYPMTVSNWVR